MKKSFLKTIYALTALVIFTGALFFCCGFAGALPKGVTVNGVEVGGLTRTAAKKLLRGRVTDYLKSNRLVICTGEDRYEYAYPETDFTDGFESTLGSIKKKGSYSSPVYFFLNGADEIAENLCRRYSCEIEEPYCVFNRDGAPFTYCEGHNGVACSKSRLLDDIAASLNGGFEEVNICTRELKRTQSIEQVKNRTRKLYSFTTYFDGGNTDRSANIRLAGEKINGFVLAPGEVFSFNRTVGERSEKNGFKSAKIIEDGKFVQGVGGGVCQVSTTLYNAALLAGLEIKEYHPHSLQVSYVAPSRDAMVSGNYCDLKFGNNRKTPVYIRVSCTLSSITCTVYGESDGCNYSFKSVVTEVVPRPPQTTVEGDEDKVLSFGRDGTVSEGYLVAERGGEISETLIRKDKYSALADIVQIKRGGLLQENPSDCENGLT